MSTFAQRVAGYGGQAGGTAGATGGWAFGKQPDGVPDFGYLPDPEPLGDVASAPPPDPKLFSTYDGSMGDPRTTAAGRLTR